MSTYNGEPYPGFFRRHDETMNQYLARQQALPNNFVVTDEGHLQWSEDSNDPDIGIGMDDNLQLIAGGVAMFAPTPIEIELREEVAALKDALTRTEAFANSLLDDDTKVDISVIRTPINIPAKSAITGDPVLRTLPGGESLKHSMSLTRTFKPKKVRNDEDYDRAMSLVGK